MLDSTKENGNTNTDTSSDDGKLFFYSPESKPKPTSRRLRFRGFESSSDNSDADPSKKSRLKFKKTPNFQTASQDSIPAIFEENAKYSSGYAGFKERRAFLVNMLKSTSEILQNMNMLHLTQKLNDLAYKVESDNFKVQIVGNFKNGKSTFINSFLGEEILPAYALPCTAVINEVKYSIEKKAAIHFKNPLPTILPTELSPIAEKHIKKHNYKDVPPLQIPYDSIEEYVVIPMGKNPKDMILESPYEKVELFWPLDLLKSGIEIIDSPGLNEHTARTKVTLDFLTKADAIVFVLNATMPCSKDEMVFIEEVLHKNGFNDLFFVVNRFDMIPEKEKKRIVEFTTKKLSPLTSFGKDGIFFLSAKDALSSKMNSDSEKLSVSGLPDFENFLEEFLTEKKSGLKILPPSKALVNFLEDEVLSKVIPKQRDMLITSGADIRKNFDELTDKLHVLKQKKQQFYNKILTDIQHSQYDFENIVRNNVCDIIDSVDGWVNEFVPKSKLGIVPGKSKIQATTDEILEHIRLEFEKSNTTWYKTTLLPVIEEKANDIFHIPKKQINELIKNIHTANIPESGKKNSFEKINSVFYTLHSAKSSFLPDSYDFAVQITEKILMTILSVSYSSCSSGILTTAIMSTIGKSGNTGIKKLKTALVDNIQRNLKISSEELIKNTTNKIMKFFSDIANKTISPLEDEIYAIQNQLDLSYFDISRGDSETQSKQQVLDKCESDIKTLCGTANRFIKYVSELK